jgi:hypothetical protein
MGGPLAEGDPLLPPGLPPMPFHPTPTPRQRTLMLHQGAPMPYHRTPLLHPRAPMPRQRTPMLHSRDLTPHQRTEMLHRRALMEQPQASNPWLWPVIVPQSVQARVFHIPAHVTEPAGATAKRSDVPLSYSRRSRRFCRILFHR